MLPSEKAPKSTVRACDKTSAEMRKGKYLSLKKAVSALEN